MDMDSTIAEMTADVESDLHDLAKAYGDGAEAALRTILGISGREPLPTKITISQAEDIANAVERLDFLGSYGFGDPDVPMLDEDDVLGLALATRTLDASISSDVLTIAWWLADHPEARMIAPHRIAPEHERVGITSDSHDQVIVTHEVIADGTVIGLLVLPADDKALAPH